MLNSGMFTSDTSEWATPQDFFDKLNAEFHFTLDPCATPENAKGGKFYTKEQNGLAQDWTGETVFCNPPYGKEISAWVEKCYKHSLSGECAVMLIPSRTDTRWFHEWVYGKAELRFVKGRLRFNDSKSSAPFPSLVVVYRGATHDEKLPPAQLGTNLAEVGTDLISRQAAIDALHMHLMYRMGTDSNKKRLDDWINGLPSAQGKPFNLPEIYIADGYDTIEGEDGNVGFGVYVPDENQIYVAGDVEGEIRARALLHEICHWVQAMCGRSFDEDEANEFSDIVYDALPSAQLEPQWIPFKTRSLTKEEKEEHPEWDGILDCKLPDDGQRILVSVSVRGHESVQYDEFYTDDGSYLDSGYEIGTEATAWMPLPEPYKGENK